MSQKSLNSFEECPLRNHSHCKTRPKNLKGPLRVVRLCILGILIPALLIAIPLYMRYQVYGNQLYPLALSDMRLLDNRISTTWCQRQLVKVNTTFNAFLMSQPPALSNNLKPMSMVRHLILEDDTKEYWGFYLLRGSTVTVSTCVRWPGASLIVIRGHKHLHECAYIGDNSSEELDELMEAIREGTYVEPPSNRSNPMNSTDEVEDDAPANEPSLMKRHRDEVHFHHPIHNNDKSRKTHTISNTIDNTDVTDPKMLKIILEALEEKTKTKRAQKMEQKKDEKKDIEEAAEDHMHVHRNSTIAKGEGRNLRIEAPHSSKTLSQEALDDIIKKLQSLGEKKVSILEELNRRFSKDELERNQTVREQVIDMKGRHYSKPAVQFDDNIDKARRRRAIELSSPMRDDFNIDDSENDLGVEEGFTPKPDGIADHRGRINETTLNDYSNSEFWSSFSSSEEALLNCAGLILNLPLTPHHKCNPDLPEEFAEETYLANTITYTVPTNGYYFFVFNSENEVQPNYIRAHFHLKKTVYNTSEAVATCKNSSSTCSMDLRFFSEQKLVMELPVTGNESLWNEEFVVISECEPRTAIYAFCVIAVPVFVVLFAFS